MNLTRIRLFISMLILFIGCNSSTKSRNTFLSINEKISVPKEIAIKIPNALEKSFNSNIQKSQIETSGSLGYLQLIDSISQLTTTQKSIELELLVINHIVEDIRKYCIDIPFDTTCSIPTGELTLTFTNELISDIKKLEEDAQILQGEVTPLNKVEFTQYNEDKIFQYTFTIYHEDEQSHSTIQWSKDKKHILSTYQYYYNNQLDFYSKIDYNELSNGERKMTVDDSFLNPNGQKENFHFNIIDKGNEYYRIQSNESFELGKSSSLGELSEKGGYLVFSGMFDNDKFGEKQTFDPEGNLLASSFCNLSIECTLEDTSTWQTIEKKGLNIETT